ncbi:MAG TPA: hypothetical protein VFD59_01930 [Nocardioidaceae bacterium]|nr:hypothetical protein [Nocardioidaceae bacterium]
MLFNSSKSKTTKLLVGVAATTALAVSLSACGSDDTDTSEGASEGSSEGTVVADIPELTGQDTAVKLDAGFVDALTQLKLTPGVVGDAELEAGSLIFPISGGNVTYYEPGSIDPYVQGKINHEGSGFSLSAGGTKVDLTNFEIDPGTSQLFGDVAVNGESAVKDAFLFQLDGRTLKPLQTEGDTAILEGTEVSISKDAAPLLNDTFKTDAVKPGLLVGTAEITVNTK